MIDFEEIIEYSQDLRLLYVEDNEDARNASIIIFEEFFDNIIIAVDGEDGLEKYNSNDIDIIITDINMPRMNGLEMVEKIREKDDDIPILVLSAYNESGYFIESIKLGVDGYILKPIEIENFLIALSKIIKKVELKQQSDSNMNLLQQYQEVTDQSSIVSKTDIDGVITYVNDEFCKVTGYSREELIGQNHSIIKHPEATGDTYKDLWQTISSKNIWQGVIKSMSKDNLTYYAKVTIKPILDRSGEIKEYIALRDNITEIMSPKRQLLDLIDSAKEAVVVLVKIDDFRNLKYFFGNKVSEDIQEKFSVKLFALKPDNFSFKKVYILGNGEFAFASDKSDCTSKMQDLKSSLEGYLHDINEAKINLDEIEFDISVVMSYSYGEKAFENAQFGLKNLEKTKQNFIFANNLADKKYDEAEDNLKTLQMVKKALDSSRVISYFQPIINNKTKKIEKYESLVRLINDDKDVLAPFHFLDVSKKGKYYAQITSAVLKNSFEALKYTDQDISINLSAMDIEKKETQNELYELLQQNIDNASRINIELLEDDKIKDFNIIKDFIKEVKKLGVKIAIDDFGTGYSNYKRLLDYQPDILKIDGSLIKSINSDSFSLSIVKTIVSFTNEHNIKTVAEYVEDEWIHNTVCELGIDYSQGYHFGKPELLVNN